MNGMLRRRYRFCRQPNRMLPQMAADSELDKTLDSTLFVPYTADARAHLRPIRFRADIANVNRCVGTMVDWEEPEVPEDAELAEETVEE